MLSEAKHLVTESTSPLKARSLPAYQAAKVTIENARFRGKTGKFFAIFRPNAQQLSTLKSENRKDFYSRPAKNLRKSTLPKDAEFSTKYAGSPFYRGAALFRLRPKRQQEPNTNIGFHTPGG